MTEIGSPPESSRELDRIISISDGVFAIVITILILDIRVPDIPPALVGAELWNRIVDLGPKFLSYVISFLVVAVYWQAHHRVFKPIRNYDRGLVWLNFLFLMSISFLPFPTSLLGEYGDQQLSVVIYAANAAASSLLLAAISWYATREQRLVGDDLDDEAMRAGRIRGLAVPVVFLLSIGVSFLSVTAAMYSWMLLFVLDPILQRVISR